VGTLWSLPDFFIDETGDLDCETGIFQDQKFFLALFQSFVLVYLPSTGLAGTIPKIFGTEKLYDNPRPAFHSHISGKKERKQFFKNQILLEIKTFYTKKIMECLEKPRKPSTATTSKLEHSEKNHFR